MTSEIFLENSFIFQVLWDSNNSKTYTYGATINIIENLIHYRNPMMAQAVKIHTWYSETSFSEFRFSPTLPLLKGGHRYALYSKYQAYPENSIFIQLDFYDIYGMKIDSIINQNRTIFFNFPEEATNYQISLVNSSNEKIVFEQLLIFESDTENTTYYFDTNNKLVLPTAYRANHEHQRVTFNDYRNQLVTLPFNIASQHTIAIGDPFLNFYQIENILENNDYQSLANINRFIHSLDTNIIFVGQHIFDSVLAILISSQITGSKIEIKRTFETALKSSKLLSRKSENQLLDMLVQKNSQ
ncbi:accessory Sec system protein Asp3 [Leuconostoc suionicum]|uniref:accessory Sec system protein Asp3 n=1 Tax=Leuconostoc suionicum TaxID=1511761 RepID=UPI001B8D3CBC|nr:accessory Sec system protein Asp3 [Leuconostoc suionicum]MBS1008895.1 accessory Sec system protein Asp3 [Leuconostoc suionicum]